MPVGPATTHSSDTVPALAGRGIVKRFSSVPVLHGIDIQFQPGRVHTLMGENGAGKSTLFKVFSGIHQPNSGHIELAGVPTTLRTPRAAQAHGVYLVPQEPALLGELTVSENMSLGHLPVTGGLLKRVDWARTLNDSRAVLEQLGLNIDPQASAKSLSIAQQQLIECAKALLRGCRTILFDEPTSPLTVREVDFLFGVMGRLRAEGYTLGFISHRMDEVLEISDEISVLRDGVLVSTTGRGAFDRQQLVDQMVGRQVVVSRRRSTVTAVADPRPAALEVTGLCSEPAFRNVSFQVRPGEVLGLAGLVGAGRTEIAEAIFGVRAKSGTVRLNGAEISALPVHEVIRRGLVYVPEDRAKHGAILPMSIGQNMSAGSLDAVRHRLGYLDLGAERQVAHTLIERFGVRAQHPDQPIRTLSGGNQQKVVLAKWMNTNPTVAILDEPTRGVDVGAKEEIYELIESLAREGLAVIVISSDLEELIRLSDRVLALYEGDVVAELCGDDITAEAVGRAFLGTADLTPGVPNQGQLSA
ncbi:sugar ABC transporter ATP-binding protein (plasmid) [Deinococcus taeanensis]|uniref:sugar ABC transporter ATP-binding protein n=1 Tax=Deinococcus taeanensis TaxID=2737050 RepID=UPI001CDB57D9|nr:sugar ABC transporter ATP-binding protein [Deinococcus taeanensis]UBV44609.1 sugar ABC transporter ATP-binding protein [Deinococcus taeanensis]